MPEIKEIEKETVSARDKLRFKYLPAYCEYLLNNRLEEFVREQIKLSRELDVPIMKLFASLSDEEIFKLSLKSNTDNFQIIIENRLSEHIADTLKKWKANELPMLSRNQIVIEDVTVGNYIRRKGYLQFLPDYTSDMQVFTGVLNELDLFIMETETQSFKMIEFIKNEELNKLVEEVEQTNHDLERSNQELTNFNYISSHDLQEPLRKINTFSNRIIETELENLSEKGKNYFTRIQASATRMQHLINDLLEFSKTHVVEKHFELCSLMGILKDVKDELKETIEENKTVFKFEKLPEINGIKFQLHQLLSNIIRNAIKYKQEDIAPIITIKSSIVDSNYSSLSMNNSRLYMKISIADNGIGFDQKHAEKIFEIFQRLHNKSEYDGTGIGLAICKKIMENHRGFIEAIGEANKGAEFNLYFPV